MTAKTREQFATEELAKIEPRLQAAKLQLELMIGDGQYVIYTGKADCPVFIALNDNRDGVLPNIGLERATRLSREHAARWAPLIRNGNNEVAQFCTERRAREMELALLESVHTMFERAANGLPV